MGTAAGKGAAFGGLEGTGDLPFEDLSGAGSFPMGIGDRD